MSEPRIAELRSGGQKNCAAAAAAAAHRSNSVASRRRAPSWRSAYSIGVVCAMYRSVGLEETLLQAFVLTASLFVLLTLFTIQSKINFSFLGAGLYGALWLLIVTGILALWLHYQWLRTAYALAGSLLFCLFIIYDTHLITSKLGYDDYIIAAIELYLDVVNLFLFLLSLLSSKN